MEVLPFVRYFSSFCFFRCFVFLCLFVNIYIWHLGDINTSISQIFALYLFGIGCFCVLGFDVMCCVLLSFAGAYFVFGCFYAQIFSRGGAAVFS